MLSCQLSTSSGGSADGLAVSRHRHGQPSSFYADEFAAARVKRIERSIKDVDTFHLVLEGLARIRLPRSLPPVLSILPPIPLPISTFSLPLSVISSSPPTDLVPIAKILLPVQLHERLAIVPPALLSDLLVTVLDVDWEKRVELLGVPDVEERSRRVKELLATFMNSKGIALPPDSDMTLVKSPSTALVRRPKSTPSGQIAGPQGLSRGSAGTARYSGETQRGAIFLC